MNKKILPLAALVAMAGAANVAQAVNVNEEGLGEVLIYPFYTVESGQSTNIAIVNTTDQYKAVKVRIREAMNTAEVLDFNIYMSPYDHWSAAISPHSGGGAQIKTSDTTCTVPQALAATAAGAGPAVPFRATDYASDDINTGVARTREGYIEVLEMGVITDAASQTAIKHVSGIPGDCSVITSLWSAAGYGGTVTPPEGGLYGWGSVIDVAEGTLASYDAVSLDNWTNGIAQHTLPGAASPSLAAGGNPNIELYDSSAAAHITDIAVAAATVTAPLNAASAVIMHDTLSNDYVLETSIGAATDWLITFPTKRDYVNNGTAVAIAPFTKVWDKETTTACESVALTFWDREEREETPEGIDFSPLPPAGDPQSLCWEANVLTFSDTNALEASARINKSVPAPFTNGWAKMVFSDGTAGSRELTTGGAAVALTYEGLPFVGFAVQKYRVGASSANYAGVNLHKTTRLIHP